MILYPDLIRAAPRCYKGLRDLVPKHVGAKPGTLRSAQTRPKWSHTHISWAIGRSDQIFRLWGKPRPGYLDLSFAPSCDMPQYISAYMALLDNAHPTHKLRKHTPYPARDEWEKHFPPIPQVGPDVVAEFMREHDISEADVRDTFEYEDDVRHQSVRLLGNDGVRWSMLQLMCDAHPYCTAVPYSASTPVTTTGAQHPDRQPAN